MPKIIENLRDQLLQEARKQIAERGYTGTTIRSVAGACGVGVGTVYNYFSSKEMLIAAFMMEDWQKQLDAMAALPKDQPEALLRGVYEALCTYAAGHQDLFSDEGAAKAISLGFAPRHRMLREQLTGFILPICKGDNAAFTAAFIAESLISWTMEGTSFDTLYPVIDKLIS
ncbi:MAG: TetR/AcrR family transcriptional regulator [Clostridia bacterium]|nr:TetR/AcrR family transcriptional regulator [Clostridia bacterium]MBP3651418.1 TetR/AcrR family transcriptional regulator [Clostridia bacterium]